MPSTQPFPTAVLQLGRRKGDEAHYEPFDDQDLKRLFESDAYTTQSFAKASEFWIPLMGLYSGARINELAQLLIDDVYEHEGVPALRINDEGDKRTKTPASIRTVPLHPALHAAGFLEYRNNIKAEGWTRLFPELTRSKVAKNAYGKEPSEYFTAYRRKCNVSREVNRKKVFHSFRTTANSVLRYRDVPKERRERLVGHEPEGTNNRDYRPSDRDKMFPMGTLLADLKQLEFSLEHPVYVADEKHRQQRLRAARRRIKGGNSEPADAVALHLRG